MIKVIMHGCNGQMGHTISKLVADDPGTQLVAGIDLDTTKHFDYPVFSSLEACDVDADVVIDFSVAPAVIPMLTAAIDKNIGVVVCTTGLNEEQVAFVHQAALKIPILFSANMSLGINLMANLVKKATQVLTGANFDIEIIEKHHNQKVDAPSGTALYIADSINEVLDEKYSYTYDRSQERIKRPKKEIGIHALRGGTIVGEHQVIFAGKDEVFEINHIAQSKEIFAVGAVNAAKYLAHQPKGMYSMGDVIE
ncbi:4-hydroxy-tetrahydrodipicolinate reductase [Vallitaleaceae bacterium 9-2]